MANFAHAERLPTSTTLKDENIFSPGQAEWLVRDVPLYTLCSFFNIVQKVGGVKQRVELFRF